MSARANRRAEPQFGLKLPDRYSVIRHIATGGMASVWCAEDGVLDRRVAIKVLSERFANDELAIRRFKREARAAARVSAHAHVVTIFDIGDIEPDGRGSPASAFIVMEYLSGGTVADALRHHAVSRDDARRWLSEAASALDHANERGIVHRDIKPGNFLLDRERDLHVADFGIARLQSEDTITSSGELFGTAAYLAPEQALGREATGASDRYSLAVAAFELLTGGRPFTATHFAAQARQHIEEEPPSASEREPTLPRAVDAVLRRGMAKEPGARYATASAFVDALGAALDDQATAATAPLLDDAPTRPLANRAAKAVGIAGVAGIAGLAAGAGEARAAGAGAARAAGAGAARAATTPRPTPAGQRAAGVAPRSRPRHPERGGRVIALLALAAVALGIILLISQLENGSRSPLTASTAHKATHHAATTKPKADSSSTASSSSSAVAPSAAALDRLGHQELLDHNYAAAISTLRRAIAAAPHSSLTYAYALYDLGDALLLSGNPKAAIPVLQQRLQIPNQTAVVQQTLNQAMQEAGVAPQPPAPGPPGHGHHGHGHGKGG